MSKGRVRTLLFGAVGLTVGGWATPSDALIPPPTVSVASSAPSPLATTAVGGNGWVAWRIVMPSTGTLEITAAAHGTEARASTIDLVFDRYGVEIAASGSACGAPVAEVAGGGVDIEVAAGPAAGGGSVYLPAGEYVVLTFAGTGPTGASTYTLRGPRGTTVTATRTGVGQQWADADFDPRATYVSAPGVDRRQVHGTIDAAVVHRLVGSFVTCEPGATISYVDADGVRHAGSTSHWFYGDPAGRYSFRVDEDVSTIDTDGVPGQVTTLLLADVTLP